MNERREFPTIAQAAELYGFNAETLRRKVASGEIQALRLPGGRDYRIERALTDRLFKAAARPTRKKGSKVTS